eukprot:scaffold4059_cov177-Amphora_coffeaeformis.AAC.5
MLVKKYIALKFPNRFQLLAFTTQVFGPRGYVLEPTSPPCLEFFLHKKVAGTAIPSIPINPPRFRVAPLAKKESKFDTHWQMKEPLGAGLRWLWCGGRTLISYTNESKRTLPFVEFFR